MRHYAFAITEDEVRMADELCELWRNGRNQSRTMTESMRRQRMEYERAMNHYDSQVIDSEVIRPGERRPLSGEYGAAIPIQRESTHFFK